MMNWIKTGIFSFLSGCVMGFVVDLVFSMTGDCGMGAAAKGIGIGVPVGNVVGVGLYRKFILHSFAWADMAGGTLALIFSAFAAIGGLYAMGVFGSLPGLCVALLGSCLCSLLGYIVGLKICNAYDERG
jgi:hypothetical protein